MPTTHRVRQGECLSSIAAHHGFSDWRLIYDDPANAALREKRPNPNVLHPGDEIVIPDKERKYVKCATGETHTIRVAAERALLRIVLKDDEEKPLGGKKYALSVGGEIVEGRTRGDGLLEEEVPTGAQEASLVLWIDDRTTYTMDLRIGHLDPVEATSGAQARLRNLGHDVGPIDGAHSEKLTAAVLAFQKRRGLKETGTIDDATRRALRDAHDLK
jgi:hypothetical protein